MGPTFGFVQSRFFGSTSFKDYAVASSAKRFTASVPLLADEGGKLSLASEMDAHFNEHANGKVFEHEWPQHLDTAVNRTITVTANATAGADTIRASLGAARPTMTTATTNVLPQVALGSRVGSFSGQPDGSWDFVGAGVTITQDATLDWSGEAAKIRAALGIRIKLSAADQTRVQGVRFGDKFRFAQGSRTGVWTVRTFAIDSTLDVATISFSRNDSLAGSGNLGNTAGATARVTRTTTRVTTEVDSPLKPGRYVTFDGHDKLYLVTSLPTASSIRITPRLYLPVVRDTVVDTEPVVGVRYSPEMEISQSYSSGVMASRVIDIREAYPDGA